MKIQYLIFFSAFLLSCNKTDKVPAELYSQEQMATILQDIYLLEFKITELKVKADSATVVFNKYQDDYFEKNELDTAIYRASYEFYLTRPDLLEQIYAIIADSLSLKSRMEEKSAEEQSSPTDAVPPADSLKISMPDSVKIVN